MSVNVERPPDIEAFPASDGGLDIMPLVGASETLGALPLGSRVVIRSRKDWRAATLVFITPDKIALSVASPSGYTYRMYRPHETPITFDGSIPLLGAGGWRVGLAKYDKRW